MKVYAVMWNRSIWDYWSNSFDRSSGVKIIFNTKDRAEEYAQVANLEEGLPFDGNDKYTVEELHVHN